ncbi:MAG: hypothetical protein GY930_01170 [bacterium]|nr:hypothetical protein [bacterium]
MKNSVLLPVVVIISLAAGAVGARIFGLEANASERKWGEPEQSGSIEAMNQRFDALSERLTDLETKQEQWLAVPRTVVEPPTASEPRDGKSGNQTDPTKQAAPATLVSGELAGNAEDWFTAITTGNLSDAEVQELWNKAVAQGKVDELIELFKERAEADPNNPELQNDLGDAYIQKVQTLGASPAAGAVAFKADKAFGKALELDPNHLDARRSKAIALSFWPPVMGKQAESIEQFEILINKQNLVPVEPNHFQAYLLLGNMHLQMGKIEEARTSWQNGLSRFPGNEPLLRQLELTVNR